MHIYKFSLPEGSDLKPYFYGAEAQISVTYRGTDLITLGMFILGEKMSLRRGVLGTTLVVNSPQPTLCYDHTTRIRRAISEHSVRYDELTENLSHFERMPINPTTRNMIQAQARSSFDQTRERMRQITERTLPIETSWAEGIHNQYYDGLVREMGINVRVDENLRPNEMAVISTTPSMPIFTQGVVNIGGNQYTINSNGYASLSTGEQVRIAPNGSIINIHGID